MVARSLRSEDTAPASPSARARGGSGRRAVRHKKGLDSTGEQRTTVIGMMEASGQVVAYFPALVPITGSVKAALLLSQLGYWEGKQWDKGRWIHKTQEELTQETGLTRAQIESARKQLQRRGFIEYVKKGLPARGHFRLNLDAIQAALLANQCAGGEPTSAAESSGPVRGEVADWSAGSAAANTESTQQTTTQSTDETTTRTTPYTTSPEAEPITSDDGTSRSLWHVQEESSERGQSIATEPDGGCTSVPPERAPSPPVAPAPPSPPSEVEDCGEALERYAAHVGAREVDSLYPEDRQRIASLVHDYSLALVLDCMDLADGVSPGGYSLPDLKRICDNVSRSPYTVASFRTATFSELLGLDDEDTFS